MRPPGDPDGLRRRRSQGGDAGQKLRYGPNAQEDYSRHAGHPDKDAYDDQNIDPGTRGRDQIGPQHGGNRATGPDAGDIVPRIGHDAPPKPQGLPESKR